jgi:ABC-type lipoprotein export system ATPase subunit
MTFTRLPAEQWHREIPGARWFKADLHVHTIDDHAGGRAPMPSGLNGRPDAPEIISQYADLFLRSVVASGVQVLGLTPHCPRVGSTPETSAVWAIVERWNSGEDADRVPFREKIYAVFPGFEPSLMDGREGLHLLFLFDPEIGRECYLKLFDVLMGEVSPWRGQTLQISSKSAEEVFEDLKKFLERECSPGVDGRPPWGHLVLAPHVDAPKGLLGAKKSQVLQLFKHSQIAGLELGDDKLPADALRNREWLEEALETYRQAFFHSSDAYSTAEIGRRYTWMKLASPRIEALRQAFVANDSRAQIAYVRAADGRLTAKPEAPDVLVTGRPWLKSVTVRGAASFFGGKENGQPRQVRFDLNPDLTCIIGGSMTGKSTLLDGLRKHTGATLPSDPRIRQQVVARAEERFLAGSPEIELECPGSNPTADAIYRWPAQFFSQNELQRYAQESGAVSEILARLVPEETGEIEERERQLRQLDSRLADLAKRLVMLDSEVAEAEQAEERAKRAKSELAAFAEAGVENLYGVGRDRQRWGSVRDKLQTTRAEIEKLLASVRSFEFPEVAPDLEAAPGREPENAPSKSPAVSWQEVGDHLEAAKRAAEQGERRAISITGAVAESERRLRLDVERKLADLGFDATRLREFQHLNQQASLLPSYSANLTEARQRRTAAETSFAAAMKERKVLRREQREAFDRVLKQIAQDFDGRIRAKRIACGDSEPLDAFLLGLGQRGITRWWHGIEEHRRLAPEILLEKLEADQLHELGMSEAVQETFRETLTTPRRRELAALRCPDRYSLELRLDDATYRPLEALSGGQRVSVLLSLLLETVDRRPLVIDQPEDELDNRFLWETVLPALKKLKGQRQVIVATHNANIVVNGDADMVIQLEATANHGHVAVSGAIEQPAVRTAIVRTVDGGDDAFRLRRVKYGF